MHGQETSSANKQIIINYHYTQLILELFKYTGSLRAGDQKLMIDLEWPYHKIYYYMWASVL